VKHAGEVLKVSAKYGLEQEEKGIAKQQSNWAAFRFPGVFIQFLAAIYYNRFIQTRAF
jgi:hypothetical protein